MRMVFFFVRNQMIEKEKKIEKEFFLFLDDFDGGFEHELAVAGLMD
jgi:hypothetical protein